MQSHTRSLIRRLLEADMGIHVQRIREVYTVSHIRSHVRSHEHSNFSGQLTMMSRTIAALRATGRVVPIGMGIVVAPLAWCLQADTHFRWVSKAAMTRVRLTSI